MLGYFVREGLSNMYTIKNYTEEAVANMLDKVIENIGCL